MYVIVVLGCFTFRGVDCILIFSLILLFSPSQVLYSVAKSLTCLTFAVGINSDLYGNSTIPGKENVSSSQAWNLATMGSQNDIFIGIRRCQLVYSK